MTLKKMLLLASSALAVVAFAAPAAAQAQLHFLDNGAPIGAGGVEDHLVLKSATIGFADASGNGISCEEATARVNVTTTEAHVLEVNAGKCKTTGALSTVFGCELTSPSAPESNTPWTVDLKGTTANPEATVTNVEVHNPMKSGCFFGEHLDILPSSVTLIPDNPASISTWTLTGTVNTEIGTVNLTGTVEDTNPGTISIADI